MHLASPLLKKKFPSIDDVVGVSINDGYVSSVVGDLGGRLKFILSCNGMKKMFDIQRSILDIPPNIVCTVKGLRSNDRDRGAVDLQ